MENQKKNQNKFDKVQKDFKDKIKKTENGTFIKKDKDATT